MTQQLLYLYFCHIHNQTSHSAHTNVNTLLLHLPNLLRVTLSTPKILKHEPIEIGKC